MEFCVPTNWQGRIIKGFGLADTKGQIKEAYGKLAFDDVGGGRTASALAFVSKGSAKEHVRQLRRKGIRFSYLLNSLCMDNLEFTSVGQRKIRGLLDWLEKIEVDTVTVANPYLAMLIKKDYPAISVTASVIANVDSLKKAQFWEGLGVDKITLPSCRNFSLIRLLKKSIKCKIQLIANATCLCSCPTYINHNLMASHASQSWHRCRGFMLDYYVILCRYKRLKNPVNFIRSEWIRPEDVRIYEKLGVDSIKLIDRRLSTDEILQIVDVYLKGSYQGNLIDLFPIFKGKSFSSHRGWLTKILRIGNPFSVSMFKALRLFSLISKLDVFIDNQKLDGFLEGIPEGCDLISCSNCDYCRATAERVVRIDADYRKNMLSRIETVMDELFSRGLSG